MLENLKELYIDGEVWEDLFYHTGKEFVEFHMDKLYDNKYKEVWADPKCFQMIRDKTGDGIGFRHLINNKIYLTQ